MKERMGIYVQIGLSETDIVANENIICANEDRTRAFQVAAGKGDRGNV